MIGEGNVTVYISIGNSDDRLPQVQWSSFVREVEESLSRFTIDARAHIHGAWVSRSDDAHQNACWCVEFPQDSATAMEALRLRSRLRGLAVVYQQEAISWASVGTQEFLEPHD